MALEGVIAGYDPGGNDAHGVALLHVVDGAIRGIETRTLSTANAVVEYLAGLESLVGLGVDTLTCWSTGPSGWRPADRWLRKRYPEVRNSVVNPNGLFGSMGINGMAVLIALRPMCPSLWITETHPKVLHWHLWRDRCDFAGRRQSMIDRVCSRWRIAVAPTSEHEWDAAISALVAFEGLTGCWTADLHAQPIEPYERIVMPCGPTTYIWPDYQ